MITTSFWVRLTTSYKKQFKVNSGGRAFKAFLIFYNSVQASLHLSISFFSSCQFWSHGHWSEFHELYLAYLRLCTYLTEHESFIVLDIAPADRNQRYAWYVFFLAQVASYADTFVFLAKGKHRGLSQPRLLLNGLAMAIVPLYLWLQLQFCNNGRSGFDLIAFSFLTFLKYLYYLISTLGKGTNGESKAIFTTYWLFHSFQSTGPTSGGSST